MPGKLTEGPEHHAEAILRAAAPALLEALEALVSWHNMPDQGNVFSQMRRVGELYAAAEAAIAKAKGLPHDH